MKKTVLLCALFCLFVAPKLVSAQQLGDMQRIGILIEALNPDDESIGLTKESLADLILVGLKRDVPKLKIEDARTSPTTIYVLISSIKFDEYNMASCVEVDIMRTVLISGDSERKIPTNTARVWKKGTILTGPTRTRASQIRDVLNEFVTAFAAQYYKDNP